MANAEIEAFLSHVAVNRQVSPSTQNQALQALFFCLPACAGDRIALAGRRRSRQAEKAGSGGVKQSEVRLLLDDVRVAQRLIASLM